MAHSPRFTARAPKPRDMSTNLRLARCTTVAECDVELSKLAMAAASSGHHLESLALVQADIDAVLDRRTELAIDENAAEAIRLARDA